MNQHFEKKEDTSKCDTQTQILKFLKWLFIKLFMIS